MNVSESRRDIIIIGEINLDIYVDIEGTTHDPSRVVVPADIRFRTGGNTWNIARMLSYLGHSNPFFICTSSEDSLSATILQNESKLPGPSVVFAPGTNSPSPIFIAVDNAFTPLIRAIQLPQELELQVDQLAYISNIIDRLYSAGCTHILLASSLSSLILEHIIKLSHSLGMKIIASVSSLPTSTCYIDYFSYISTLVLNIFEAREITSILGCQEEDNWKIAQYLSGYVKEVVITCGSEGAISYNSERQSTVCLAPDLQTKFVNDLGAGDTFLAFLIDGYFRKGSWLTLESLAWATSGAALTCCIKEHMPSMFYLPEIESMFTQVIDINK